MRSRLFLLVLTCNAIFSAPTESNITLNTSQIPKPVPELLPELVTKIAELSDTRTSLALGMVSKQLHQMTEPRNRKTRLLQIMQHCGLKQYLDLTSNGHLLFTNLNDNHRPYNYYHEVYENLSLDAICNRAIRRNIRDITVRERFSQLKIHLPSINVKISPDMVYVIEDYIKSLQNIIKNKSSYQKVIVTTIGEWGPRYVNEILEDALVKILSKLTINELVLRVKLRRPNHLINPTVQRLSAQDEFFRNIQSYQGLPNLDFILMPSLNGIEPLMVKIAGSTNITGLAIPKHLVAEALSNQYSFLKLYIRGSSRLYSRDHIIALMNTSKPLKELDFDWHVCSSIEDMSPILQKFKPSLESLSVTLGIPSEYEEWVNLLRLLLFENRVLKELYVHLNGAGVFNHSFLIEALNLETYSYSGLLPTRDRQQSLLDFISSQTSLKTLYLDLYGFETEWTIILFYEKLVSAILVNPSIKRVYFENHAQVAELKSFQKLFLEKTKPLLGRELLINTIPVENIVSDLAVELKDILAGG